MGEVIQYDLLMVFYVYICRLIKDESVPVQEIWVWLRKGTWEAVCDNQNILLLSVGEIYLCLIGDGP